MSQHALDHRLTSKLTEIINDDIFDTIKGAVAKEALTHESPSIFFKGLAQSGCISGWVGSLVYYSQTHEFYDHHYEEIEELRHEFESEVNPMYIAYDLKNTYAWFAFEVVSFRLADELGLEL